jgi:hypothetical protein
MKLIATQAIIEKVAGFRPNIFRPPYGSRWFGLVPALCWNAGMHLDPMVRHRVRLEEGCGRALPGPLCEELKPGAIILLHDGRETRPADEIDRSAHRPGVAGDHRWGAPGRICFCPTQGISSCPLALSLCGKLPHCHKLKFDINFMPYGFILNSLAP